MRPRKRHNYNFRFRWLALDGNVGGVWMWTGWGSSCLVIQLNINSKNIRVCGGVWRKQVCLPLFALLVFTFYFLLFRLTSRQAFFPRFRYLCNLHEAANTHEQLTSLLANNSNKRPQQQWRRQANFRLMNKCLPPSAPASRPSPVEVGVAMFATHPHTPCLVCLTVRSAQQ